MASFVAGGILARSSRGLPNHFSVVNDNLPKKAMEFSLLTSADPYLPRDATLRLKRRKELAAIAEKWMNYSLFISLFYSSWNSLNVNALRLI